MQEVFWFFLGGFVYFVVDKTVFFFKKVKFINEVKIHSFRLIGFAFEEFIVAMTTKHIMLELNPDIDKEKIKLIKNSDEITFERWKKDAAAGLRNSVPSVYRGALEIENWDDIMNNLDNYHKRSLRYQYKSNKD